MTNDLIPLLILGSGAAGCTAAIYAARAGHKPVLLRGNQPGGQLTITTEVENYPGFPSGIMGPALMEKMEEQASACGAIILSEHIVKAKVDAGSPFVLTGQSGKEYRAKALIIATGASAKWLGIASEQTFSGKGVSACATCDGSFYKGRDVMVIGGGNSAMEEALYLAGMCASVTIVHRREQFRGEKVLQERVLNHPKISVIWNNTVDEILGDPHPITGGVTGVRLKNVTSGSLKDIPTHGVFVAIGHHPNTDIFKGQLDCDDVGYLKVKPGTVTPLKDGKTIPGLFAAGDVADAIYRQAVTAAGMGCMAALDANRYLEGL